MPAPTTWICRHAARASQAAGSPAGAPASLPVWVLPPAALLRGAAARPWASILLPQVKATHW